MPGQPYPGPAAQNQLPPPAYGPPASAPPPATQAEPPREHWISVNANVAGMLLYGPTLAVELGRTVSIALRVRIGNLGLLNYLGYDSNESYNFSIGAAIAARLYPSVLNFYYREAA